MNLNYRNRVTEQIPHKASLEKSRNSPQTGVGAEPLFMLRCDRSPVMLTWFRQLMWWGFVGYPMCRKPSMIGVCETRCAGNAALKQPTTADTRKQNSTVAHLIFRST